MGAQPTEVPALELRRPEIGALVSGDALQDLESLTVEAWIDGESYPAEALQVVASKWRIRESFDRFTAHDASHTSGMDTRGFFGAVFDGRYVYFVPQHDGSSRHGKVLRYDTRAEFHRAESWSAYNAERTSGLVARGYYGAVFDGRYVFFVPRTDGTAMHTRLLRYDTQGPFDSAESWRANDIGIKTSYQSAGFDGRYIYFCPGYNEPPAPHLSSAMLRYDTLGGFSDPASYRTYDATQACGPKAACFDGAVFDGRYVYFAPLEHRGQALRFDTRGGFTEAGSWHSCDAAMIAGKPMGQCVGATFDGRYVYYVPYANGVAVRFDTTCADFAEKGAWSAFDAAAAPGLRARGYDGAIFDGRFVYYIPFWEGADTARGFHGRVLRYDATREFADPQSWRVAEAGQVDGLQTIGFNAGAFDGRYIYFAPWRAGTDEKGGIIPTGNVLRYDTTGDDAAFSLRAVDFGHNGGLCAAVPGAAFLVNTTQGVLCARANRPLAPGKHHLVGVYNGRDAGLYLDGLLTADQRGGGRISNSRVGLSIGKLQDGLGVFKGRIGLVRIFREAATAEWVAGRHRQGPDGKSA